MRGAGLPGAEEKTQFDVRYFAEHTPAPDTMLQCVVQKWRLCVRITEY